MDAAARLYPGPTLTLVRATGGCAPSDPASDRGGAGGAGGTDAEAVVTEADAVAFRGRTGEEARTCAAARCWGTPAVVAWRAARASAAALGHRALGSLANARSTTERTAGGMSAGSGGSGSRTCFIAMSSGLVPAKGRRPARHWYATTPRE